MKPITTASNVNRLNTMKSMRYLQELYFRFKDTNRLKGK